jgi:hypothetical protein
MAVFPDRAVWVPAREPFEERSSGGEFLSERVIHGGPYGAKICEPAGVHRARHEVRVRPLQKDPRFECEEPAGERASVHW